jgi:hypothetical protein
VEMNGEKQYWIHKGTFCSCSSAMLTRRKTVTKRFFPHS